MRIAFVDPDSEVLTNDVKGRLLEALATRLVQRAGFTGLALRRKHSSLEYDLEGRHMMSSHLLQGEAKAHERTVSGKELLAFVAKVLPFGQRERTDALFISTSDISPEGRDWLESNYGDGWILPGRLHLRTLIGGEITSFLQKHGLVASDSTIEAAVRAVVGSPVPLDSWLVLVPDDVFIVATASSSLASGPTGMLLLRSDGRPLTLDELVLRRLRLQLPDLADLSLLSESAAPLSASDEKVLPTVVGGRGWFDYRFPASPEHFVGRVGPIADIRAFVATIRSGTTASRGVQVVARSGVGKSSLLLNLPVAIPQVHGIVVDGRTMRAATDVRVLAAQFARSVNDHFGQRVSLPSTLDQVDKALRVAVERVVAQGCTPVIAIDQFESLIVRPEAFNAIVDLLHSATVAQLPILFAFGRKNDLALTPDASAASALDQLNSLTRIIQLSDFGFDEEDALLQRMPMELKQSLDGELREAILLFSGGFPWLLKRLCAHAIAKVNGGASQRSLAQSGLLAQDLFDEDLAGLSESDRALIRKLAVHLPNTAAELARRLEGEVGASLLTTKLNEYLGMRLLRLSGDTYDTYNDVFKTYLVTGNIPFRSRWVFRVAPKATIELLDAIADFGKGSLADFTARVGGNQIAVLNKLRELRLLGLIDPAPGVVSLSTSAKAAIDEGDLARLLRNALLGNGLVVAVLDLLAGGQTASLDQVRDVLQKEVTNISAAPETWRTYTKLVLGWLHYAQLAHFDRDVVTARVMPQSEALGERKFTRAVFRAGTFLPSVRPDRMVEALLMLSRSGGAVPIEAFSAAMGTRDSPGLIRDGVGLDLVEYDDSSVSLGRTARALLAEYGEELKDRHVAQTCLAKENVKALLDASLEGPLDQARQQSITASFGAANWTEDTWRWRLGLLRSWLVQSGQAISDRHGLRGA